MITKATVSVIALIIVLITAWGFYAAPGKKYGGRGLYAIMLAFAIVQIASDGVLRVLVGEPSEIAMSTLTGAGFTYYVFYLLGTIGVLQMGFDMAFVLSKGKQGRGTWIAVHIPAVLILLSVIIVKGRYASSVLKYMPLLYTLIVFFVVVWFFEKLDKGFRFGMIAVMVVSVLMFMSNTVFRITELPALVPALAMIIGCSWSGRAIATEEEEEVTDRAVMTEKPVKDNVKNTDEQDEETADIEVSELEKMMMEGAGKTAEKLEIDPGEDATPEQMEVEKRPSATKESEPEVLATGMIAVDPSPMEQLEAATVLTAESNTQTEDLLQTLQQVEETLSDALHSRPLILEKDLNEYYHRMKQAITNKDYDTCLEILSEMSEYRISGIHLTRYERIRHAVVDEEWKIVESELKSF